MRGWFLGPASRCSQPCHASASASAALAAAPRSEQGKWQQDARLDRGQCAADIVARAVVSSGSVQCAGSMR